MDECIFCKIGSHEADADIVLEADDGVVFRDIQPKAPVHLLVIPKRHVVSLAESTDKDRDFLGGLLLLAAEAARQEGIAESGYKVAINVGRGAGQVVDHFHLHVLGGWTDGP